VSIRSSRRQSYRRRIITGPPRLRPQPPHCRSAASLHPRQQPIGRARHRRRGWECTRRASAAALTLYWSVFSLLALLPTLARDCLLPPVTPFPTANRTRPAAEAASGRGAPERRLWRSTSICSLVLLPIPARACVQPSLRVTSIAAMESKEEEGVQAA
jgi:hypothetical protein